MLYKCDKSTNYITKKQEKTIFLLAAHSSLRIILRY